MSKLLVANWKMNPLTEGGAIKLAKASDKKGVVVCPPFVFLEAVGKVLKRAELGAQDVFWDKGAFTPLEISRSKRLSPSRQKRESGFLTGFTGEVSVKELKTLGVKYVILGHSERRIKMGETDEMVNKKVIAALKAGLKVILCVGEPTRGKMRNERGQTRKFAKQFVKNQLQKDLKSLGPKAYALMPRLIIAYEPVWAISTNKNAKNDTPEDAAEMIKFIKQVLAPKAYVLAPKVLYGGSVSAKTIGGFLKQKEIDGFLVGGASLRPQEFGRIIKIAQKDW